MNIMTRRLPRCRHKVLRMIYKSSVCVPSEFLSLSSSSFRKIRLCLLSISSCHPTATKEMEMELEIEES